VAAAPTTGFSTRNGRLPNANNNETRN